MTTSAELQVFIELFREFTNDASNALYYFGILTGIMVFPIYGVVLLRRHTRMRMENILTRIEEWDPWLWSSVRQESIFVNDRVLDWLDQLCVWQKRYRGLRLVFGMPDLEAKCIQLTRALLAVFLSHAYEIKDLTDRKRNELAGVLDRLKRIRPYPGVDRLQQHLSAPARAAADLDSLHRMAEEIHSWRSYLLRIGLPSHLPPEDVVLRPSFSEDHATIAVFLWARGGLGFREQLRSLLRAADRKFGQGMRSRVILADRLLGADGTLVAGVRHILLDSVKLDKFREAPAWRKFELAFSADPVEVLGADPEDDFSTMRKKYRRLMMNVHPDLSRDRDATEDAKALTLAWQVILKLRKKGVLK